MKLIQNIVLFCCVTLTAFLFWGCEKETEQYAEVVETTRIKEITYDSAVAVSYVKGVCSERGIWYAAETTPEAETRIAAPKGSDSQFEIAITGLEAGVKYIVRTYAICNGETIYSPLKYFSSLREGEPIIRITKPAKISNTTALMEGYVIATGGKPVLERGFCYGATDDPASESNLKFSVKGDIGRLNGEISELVDGDTYFSWVYVRNELGVFYSEAEMFNTLPFNKPLPSVISIADMGTVKMTIKARVDSDNNLEITERGIRYSLTENFDDGMDVAADTPGLGEYTVTVTGLDPEQLYNVWAYAANRKGKAYSEMMTVKALVRVEEAAALGYSATGKFSIANLGVFLSPVTEAGICWSTSPAPTIADNHTQIETGTSLGIGSFEGLRIGGLKPQTQYYLRAYAINEYGRSYSKDYTFTTRSDLYNTQFRPGAAGGKLPYFNGWQIILNDVTSAANANVPEEALSPAFAAIYANLGKACQSYKESYMNGVIYRLRQTTDGGLIMQFTLYFRANDAKKTLTSTGWTNIQFERNEADGTFRFIQNPKMTSAFYTGNTPEGKGYIDAMFDYFKEHSFYFEWVTPEYVFTSGMDNKTGPIRMVPVDAPDDYWTFTTKNYTAAGDINPIANPF